jgi:arylsulfatase A-like enzyme
MVGFLTLLFSCELKEKENENFQPNVLFIMVDDLNDYLGSYGGHPQAKTPNIDKLASQGVRFVNAHTNIGLCNPSRNSLFTGVYPHQSRNFGLDKKTTQKLFQNNNTILELFSENGYYVMGSGKLLHNNRLELWDEWGVQVNNYGPFAYNGADQVGHPSVPQPFRSIGDVDGSFAPLSDVPVFPKSQIKGDRPGWAYSGHEGRIFHYSNENDRDMLPDEMHAQWAANRIRQMDQEGIDQPFFMGVGFVRPHTPLYAPKRFFEMFPMEEIHLPLIKKGDVDDTHYKGNYPVERTEDDKWYTNTSKGQMYYKLLAESYEGREEEGLKHFIQAYLACVAFADEQVGIVLEALNNSSFKENTTIVLTSDHGWQMGTKEYLFKNSPWANSTHIPLVIKTPGGPRKQVDHPVSLIDIYPTLQDFCHLEGNNTRNESGFELGGVSLRKLIENPNADEWPGPAGTLTAIATDMVDYELNAQTFSYTTAKYRYIMYPNGQEEFYELGIDPHEWNNLASDSGFEATKNELRESIMELIRN